MYEISIEKPQAPPQLHIVKTRDKQTQNNLSKQYEIPRYF